MKITLTFFLLLHSLQILASEKVLNRGNGGEVDSLNIHLAEGINAHNILRDVYEGLMTLDKKGNPIYGIAKNHIVDGLTWTFELWPNKKWSEGSNVTAYDFVNAWKKAISPETAAPYAFLFSNIVNADEIMQGKLNADELAVWALDKYRIKIKLKSEDSDFLEKLTLPIFYPLLKNNPKTFNGVYRVSERVLQEKIVLQKNNFHPDSDKTYFNQVVYWVTENQSSELKRYRAGELDITETIPDSQMSWIRKNLGKDLRVYPYLGSFFLGLNTNYKELKNINFRKALYHAVDRKILVEKVLKSGQKPAYRVIPNLILNQSEETPDRELEISKAQKYFKDSGFDPSEIKLELLYNNSINQRKTALAVAAMFREVLGIKVWLKNQEWKVFTQTRKTHNKQIFRSGWIADYNSPLSFLKLFESESHFNFYAYNNKNFDQSLNNALQIKDQNMKNKALQKVEDIIIADLPVIPLYYYVSRHLVVQNLQGYEDNISDRHLSRYLNKN